MSTRDVWECGVLRFKSVVLVAVALVTVGMTTSEAAAQVIGGVPLVLNQSRDTVLARLRQHFRVDSIRATDVGVQVWSVRADSLSPRLGEVTFRRGHLESVAQYWPIAHGQEPEATTRTIIGALSTLDGDVAACKAYKDHIADAGTELTSVTVWCGAHGIALEVITVDGAPHTMVTEWWMASR